MSTESHRTKPTPGQADAVVNGALGWLFIVVGLAAIAAAALIPAYLDTLDLQQARAEQTIRASMLAEERARYENFYIALRDDDPVLIQRLAISELRLKPAGTEVAEHAPRDPLALVTDPSPATIERAMYAQPLARSIENEISRPDLKREAEITVELDRPRRTRLVVLSTGEHRPWVAGFGALMLLMGLWPRRVRRAQADRSA